MSDSQAEPRRTWTTDLVERSIKQPVKEAVREALAEPDAVRTTEASSTDDADEPETAGETGMGTDEADGEGTASGRPSAPRLLLVAGCLAGVAYAATRWHRRNDPSADADEETDAGPDTSADDPSRDDDRPAHPAEDATAN